MPSPLLTRTSYELCDVVLRKLIPKTGTKDMIELERAKEQLTPMRLVNLEAPSGNGSSSPNTTSTRSADDGRAGRAGDGSISTRLLGRETFPVPH